MAAAPILQLAASEPTMDDVLLGRARCASCGAKPAPFGFDCSVLQDRPGLWFCATHRADGNRRRG